MPTSPRNADLPLAGIKVLDLGRILAAPLAAQALGDLGADVIKVERPGRGDEARRWGPPFLKDEQGLDTRESPMYLSANRNKRSVMIDFSKPKGQALVRRLAEQSDVLIENYKVGDLVRYGLDYDHIRAVNPRIVCCSVTGFGQSGPYSKEPGYDSVFQAMSGLMSVTGLPDGVPGAGPMKTGPSTCRSARPVGRCCSICSRSFTSTPAWWSPPTWTSPSGPRCSATRR